MLVWAWKSLIAQRGAVLGGALGIAGSFILVVFFHAVFRGESGQIVAYPEHMQPDVWVMQRGVRNMHMATSSVWDWKADKVADIPGVARVTPILYLNSVITAGNQKSFSFIVGLLPDDHRAGPWEMVAGREVSSQGETVIPDVLSNLLDVSIGDRVTIADTSFTIVGLSTGTYSMANSVIFVAFSDLERILSSSGTYSYLLVDAEEGIDPEALAGKIRREVEKVNALPHEEFVENDFAIAMQMGVEIIFMMTVISAILAILIVCFTAYSLVMRKRRELAIAKALGMRGSAVLFGVVFQSCILTLFGFAIAAVFAMIVIPYIPLLLPQLSLTVAVSELLQIGVTALLVAMVGAIIPAYLVLRLDPATAFNV